MNNKLLEDIFRAYYDARQNKRNKKSSLKFEINYEKNIFNLYKDIKNRKYEPSKSTVFVVKKPVKREIFAAHFRDRVVHHLIFNYINPVFEKNFIKDSYSCRIGKGTSYGILRAEKFIRSCSENYSKDCWILKLDIQGYFMSINKIILYEKIEKKLRKIKYPDFDMNLILYLTRKTIFHDPTKNFILKGERGDWAGLPVSKSLFFSKKDCGLPIGNLTSQLFGNIYLDEFDHFVKEKLGIKHYGRYVDDMIIFHENKKFLKLIIAETKKYLQNELGLELHPKKIYLQHFIKGVKFLGVFIKPYCIYISKRTKGNFYAKIKMWNKIIENKKILSKKEIKDFIACMNSYLGLMKHFKTFILRKKMLTQTMSKKFNNHIIFDKIYSKLKIKI